MRMGVPVLRDTRAHRYKRDDVWQRARQILIRGRRGLPDNAPLRFTNLSGIQRRKAEAAEIEARRRRHVAYLARKNNPQAGPAAPARRKSRARPSNARRLGIGKRRKKKK